MKSGARVFQKKYKKRAQNSTEEGIANWCNGFKLNQNWIKKLTNPFDIFEISEPGELVDEDLQEALDWLKVRSSPWYKVEEKWIKSRTSRLASINEIQSTRSKKRAKKALLGGDKIKSYFDKFSALSNELGYSLVSLHQDYLR